jgi:hypothetical protein
VLDARFQILISFVKFFGKNEGSVLTSLMHSSIASFKGATSAPERIWTLLTAAYLNCNGKFFPPSSIHPQLVCDFLRYNVEVNPVLLLGVRADAVVQKSQF